MCYHYEYRCTGVTGRIEVNGKLRSHNSESFRTLSCYIHQDDELRGYLTVKESMMIAAHLKLGYKISITEKKKIVSSIIEKYSINLSTYFTLTKTMTLTIFCELAARKLIQQ